MTYRGAMTTTYISRRGQNATLQLGDLAPDFVAATADGQIRFHEWLGPGWGVLFSHPADFTPVCTTELGAVARLADQFAARDTKVAAVSSTPPTPPCVDRRHRGNAGRARRVPPDRRSRPPRREPVRADPPAPRRNRDGAAGFRHRGGQDDQADAHLPCEHGTRLRRDPARA